MAQQQQQGGDSSLGPVWIIVGLFALAFVIWSVAHQYIVAFIFTVNVWQAKLINLFVRSELLSNQIYVMQTIDPASIDINTMLDMTRVVGNYLRYPVVMVLAFLAVYLYKSNVTLKYKKTYSMKSLREQEQNNWKAIMPVVNTDLVKADISKGPWAMGLSPMEFAKKYELLKKDDAILDNPHPAFTQTAGLRKGDAKRVFTLQLGAYWDGFERLPPQAYALAAVFCARINRDRANADKILETIDETFAQGKPDFSVAKPVIEKYKNSDLVQKVVQKHAYQLTVLAGLLEAARDDGVVPSSEFLWCKVVDRRLFYVLNSIGRQTPFAEVSGAIAHFLAEKAMGRRSLVPMVDEAIKALEVAIKEVKLSPEEMEELQP